MHIPWNINNKLVYHNIQVLVKGTLKKEKKEIP